MTQAVSIAQGGSNNVTFRNRIINGAMMVSQRGTAFATPANLAYTLDRWLVNWAGAAPSSINQVAGPTGYKNALRLSGGASNTGLNTQQRIESLNCTDLSGATVTIQANIAVSSAQTIGWALQYANAADNFSGGVTSIASGTWSATTTATVFTATVTNLPAGALNGIALLISPNNGAGLTSGTVDITGVQLEAGSTATPFEQRLYGTELALCQRYAYVVTGVNNPIQTGLSYGTTTANCVIPFPVTMRTSPSVTYAGTTNFIATNGSGAGITSTNVNNYVASPNTFEFTIVVASGLTVGQASIMRTDATGSAKITLSAEL